MAVKNAIQAAADNKAATTATKPKTIQQYVKSMEAEIAKALPSVITPERFSRIVLTALSSNPKLQECTPQSFLGAMMTAAQLGVEPNTALGQAYLIPFKNKGVMECQFQLGYKGLIDLAYRSGEVSNIQAQEVYENDVFEFEYGLEPKLRHVPAKKDRGDVICYYAIFKMKDGGYNFGVMSVDDARKHGQKYSKSYSFGPWQNNFDEMAKKTVLKKVLKYAPLKSDFVRAVAQDETIKNDISDDMSFVPDETIIDAEVTEVAEGEIIDTETGELINA